MKRKVEDSIYQINYPLLNKVISKHIDDTNYDKAFKLIEKHYTQHSCILLSKIPNLDKLGNRDLVKKIILNDLQKKLQISKNENIVVHLGSLFMLVFISFMYYNNGDPSFQPIFSLTFIFPILSIFVFIHHRIKFSKYKNKMLELNNIKDKQRAHSE